MLATKLSTVCRVSAGIMLRPSLSAAPRTPLTHLVRGYREAGRPFTRRSKLREAQAQVAQTTQTTKGKIGPLEVGQIAVAGGAVLGIGAICYYGLGMSNEPGAIDRVV
ncbi:hypothetical protein GWK47_050317 [Chionoecetes opilio]|uniref:GHITM protein n=1 Tax=Chionoecetes opilio TaxID=41210 RepID=A0A8J4Y2Q8_CHIOP|nr:hypothetical protein GWK47_050317 [Chionoecetes opilio]